MRESRHLDLTGNGVPRRGVRRSWAILLVLSATQLMLVLDSTIMNIALPSVQAGLGFATADRQWVITAYALAFGGMLLTGGRLSDMLGAKQMLLAASSGFVIASVLGGLAGDLTLLVTARALGSTYQAPPHRLSACSPWCMGSQQPSKHRGPACRPSARCSSAPV